MNNDNIVDNFFYQNIENKETKTQIANKEREKIKEDAILKHLFVKKTYAICLFIVCVDGIFNRIFKPDEYENVELILNTAVLTYIFIMEVILNKHYTFYHYYEPQ